MRSPFRSNDVLVDALKKQDEKAITYFLRRYRRGIFLFCEEDEDITQEAIETALQNIERYDKARSTFITWVYGIARKLFLKQKREQQKLQVVYAEDYLQDYDEEETGGNEREEWLKPNSNTSDQFPELLSSLYLEKESKDEIERAIRMLTKHEQAVLRDFCYRKKPRYSADEQKMVFRKLRINLQQLRESEEKIIRKRLSA